MLPLFLLDQKQNLLSLSVFVSLFLSHLSFSFCGTGSFSHMLGKNSICDLIPSHFFFILKKGLAKLLRQLPQTGSPLASASCVAGIIGICYQVLLKMS